MKIELEVGDRVVVAAPFQVKVESIDATTAKIEVLPLYGSGKAWVPITAQLVPPPKPPENQG